MPSAHLAYLEHAGALLSVGVPQHFGDVGAEYNALTQRCGLLDCSAEARVDVAGSDAPAFLHRLLTAAVKHLVPGRGTPAFLLTSTAKIVQAVIVLRVDEIRYKLLAPPTGRPNEGAAPELGSGATLLADLDRFLFTERVELSDLSSLQSVLTVQGPLAAETLERIGLPAPVAPFDHAEGHLAGLPVRIARHDRFGGAGFDVFVPLADFEAAWGALVGAGAHPAGHLAAEMCRIEAGVPATGSEFTAETSPLEVSGLFGITEGKGCYPGQEVIERTLALGAPPRALIRIQGEHALTTGAEVGVTGAAIGHLTSAVTLPDGRHFGLALVKRRFGDTNEPLRVGNVPARRLD